MSNLFEPFQYAFFRNGVAVATVSGALCGLIGVYVVLRGMSYIGHGLSHSIFGGFALSTLVGVNPFLGAGLWGFGSALATTAVTNRRKLGADAAIGVITTGSYAMGIVAFKIATGPKQNFDAAVFGSILGTSRADVVRVVGVTILASIVIFFRYRSLLFNTFDPDVAEVMGVNRFRVDALLMLVLASAILVTMNVIGAVEPTLRKAEIERARRKRPDNLDAYDLFLKALPLVSTAMPADADKALLLLHEAIVLEPDYAIVHGFIAWCHEQRYLRGGLHSGTREAARRHAHLAIRAGADDAMALAMGGFVVGVVERDYETALEALDRSLALSPSSALAFGFSAIVRAWMGDDATAIEHAKIGIRLSPFDPLIFLPYVGLAYANFFAGHFLEAASAAKHATAANPRFSVPC